MMSKLSFKLTLIIPIYNVERYIRECLVSVFEQLPPDVEVICIDDGSPDNSIEIAMATIEDYDINEKQVKIISQKNKGLSGARNTGIKAASGSYIGFLDSDDKLKHNYFKYLLDVINGSDYDIIDFNYETSGGTIYRTRNQSLESVFQYGKWYSWARIVKKTLLSKYLFTEGILYEDIALTPKLYFNANSFFHIDKALYWYRLNPEGITASRDALNNERTIKSLDIITNEYIGLYNQTNSSFYKTIAFHCYLFLCASACSRYNIKKAYQYIDKYKSKLLLDKDQSSLLHADLKLTSFVKRPKIYILLYSLSTKFKKLRGR